MLDVFKLLEDTKAILVGTHVVYTSGRHGDAYVDKDALYPFPGIVSSICAEFAQRYSSAKIEVVAGPALGGIALSQWTAHHLSRSSQVLAVFAEKQTDGGFPFKRGYDALLRNKTVLLVEDIITTGGSIKAVSDAVREAKGVVAGVSAICNRGGVRAEDFGAPMLFSITELPLTSWPQSECPLCRQRVPVNVEVGKGGEFLGRRQRDLA
jgi:orotate phosphoribosyltransferase